MQRFDYQTAANMMRGAGNRNDTADDS